MEYTVIRSGRKTVAIQLNQDLTVTVRAPWRASKSEIERILQEKKPWIEKHLDQMRRRKEHYDASGTDKLTDEEIQELANKALKYIPERVAYFSKIIGVTYGRITIRNQKTTIVNPLPAHYYCPACKKMEFFKETKCGIDLPDKKCSCGEKLKKDGFGIATVNIFPLRKWMEITVSKNGTGLVKKCLDNYFKEYGVVREVIISNNVKGEDAFDRFNVKRYMVVSEELNKRFPEKIVRLSFEEYYNTAHDILGITVVEADKSVEFKYVDIEFSKKQIKEYYNYAKENDIFDDPVRNIHLPKILADIKEPSFGDLVAINGFLHGTGVWENNAEYLYKKGIPLQDMIYCCEDVYSYLYDKLKGVNSDNLSGLICEIKNSVCKGKYLKNTMPQEIEKLLDENEVPEWYIESMKKIRYLFPKAHIIASLKKDIEEFLILEKNRKLY